MKLCQGEEKARKVAGGRGSVSDKEQLMRGRGQVQRRLRVCEWEAGLASRWRGDCPVAAEAPPVWQGGKNRAVQKTYAFYILVSKMQMSCWEPIYSFTNLNIQKGIKFLKLEVLNNYHKSFTVPTYELTSISL